MNFRTALLAIFMLSAALSPAQTLVQKADSAFAKGKFATAIELYEKALRKNKDITEPGKVHYRLGHSYYSINKYADAKSWIAKSLGASEPRAYWIYGEILMISKEYREARAAYAEYQKLTGDKAAAARIASCDFAMSGKRSPVPLQVKNVEELNTPYSEFGIARMNDELIFSSSRISGKERQDNFTGQGFSDIYTTKLSGSRWQAPEKIKGGINTKFNEGTFSYNEKEHTGYFMQCNGVSGDKQNCSIFCSVYNPNDKTWGKARAFDYTHPTRNTGHPAITSDGNTLFFVSDMEGTLGGKDIWILQRVNGVWGQPVNAGNELNTPGDEMFPSLAGDTLLFFSSNYHPGYGGLDIFYVPLKNKAISGKPVNMLEPVNSAADDFSIVLGRTILEGLFCSNREGGKGQDDIYAFSREPLVLNAVGMIIDAETNKPVSNVTVYFKDNNGIIDSILTGNTGEFNFKNLKPDLTYSVIAVKQGFFSDSKSLSTLGVKENMEFSKKTGVDLDFGLLKISKKEVVIPNISYDFNSAELKQDSKKELDKLARILIETPKVIVEISSHTDEKGADDYNMSLSQKRAQNVVTYLAQKGVPRNRMIAKGYGESQPLKKNAQTEEEHALNRRTTFKVIKN